MEGAFAGGLRAQRQTARVLQSRRIRPQDLMGGRKQAFCARHRRNGIIKRTDVLGHYHNPSASNSQRSWSAFPLNYASGITVRLVVAMLLFARTRGPSQNASCCRSFFTSPCAARSAFAATTDRFSLRLTGPPPSRMKNLGTELPKGNHVALVRRKGRSCT